MKNIRNIAIIAHVDHGKTTLVDQLLRQSGTLGRKHHPDRMMDSNDLEKERGITIVSKTTAVQWNDFRINIVDTPGHADFGGEVERVLSMVDSVLLVVDAFEGPMPQTRFVTAKAFEQGLNPIVVVNKIDRPGARPDEAIDKVFDLFDSLGATDAQLDFPVVYASALQGFATLNVEEQPDDMQALFETIIDKVSPPDVRDQGPFQMQVSTLDYSSYVGTIGIGRVKRGCLPVNSPIEIVKRSGDIKKGRILQVFTHHGLERVSVDQAKAGDIVCVTGVDDLQPSDTICSVGDAEALPLLSVDEPTLSIFLGVNQSPFAGKEGKYLTARHLKERLRTESIRNVALRVEETDSPDSFKVSGRGELHLTILLEQMRREGYEMVVSRPEIVIREVNGERQEPYELLSVDVDPSHQGSVMECLGERKGLLQDMEMRGDRMLLSFLLPTRALMGVQSELLSITSGTGIVSRAFDHYGPWSGEDVSSRDKGVLIATSDGAATAYALFALQARGRLLIGPQVETYEGMIVGIHSRENDLMVNVQRAKQLTNIRASGSDENIILSTPQKVTLEYALEFINDDELVEITPKNIRLRKKWLKEHERKRNRKT